MPTASRGHQSEWTTISNQWYTFAADFAIYNRTKSGRSGLLGEAINLLIKKIMCIGQGLREFHQYRLRLPRWNQGPYSMHSKRNGGRQITGNLADPGILSHNAVLSF